MTFIVFIYDYYGLFGTIIYLKKGIGFKQCYRLICNIS